MQSDSFKARTITSGDRVVTRPVSLPSGAVRVECRRQEERKMEGQHNCCPTAECDQGRALWSQTVKGPAFGSYGGVALFGRWKE